MRVLLVEDDDPIALSLTQGLLRHGYEVDRVGTGAAALAAAPADVVLLDLGLPDVDGLDVCRELRARTDVPIIVITARADEVDTVAGLEVGADDYVAKPFGVREVIARIRAVLRRTRREQPDDTTPEAQRLGTVALDRRARRVHVADEEVALTPKEFDLLALLAESPGAVFTREHLIEAVWDEQWFGSTRTLDVHVSALRRKFGAAITVSTVRGVGFRLERP
ncbi:response regulator transcription factor [Umezawaea sp. NPDC059074]|uniref:response regulator transcription factor n=1 Tax=Umezawaea sp. NPDC059074 TaxID=3346716 RepID=UPI0036CB0A1C